MPNAAKTVSKEAVARFWEGHPLGSYEIGAAAGSPEYFKRLERVRDASSRFAMSFYRFEANRGRKVLDLGCGPGWITRRYAQAGARVTAVDLTSQALALARQWLDSEGLNADLRQADAESLPFADHTFDWVSCDGVLHHTPGTEKGLAEIYRVLAPGGGACISVYYENILLRPWVFPLTRFLVRLAGVRLHGVGRLPADTSRETFVRYYDGVDNPLGKVTTRRQAARRLREAGFQITGHQVYYFPVRFVPGLSKCPTGILKWLDRCFGTMIFFSVRKPAS